MEYENLVKHRDEQMAAQSRITTGDLVVNLDAKNAELNGEPIRLTGKEYEILELLALRKGSTMTKEMFLNHLYGGLDEPEAKIIDVFICKLRKKLNANGGHDYIETIWGRGYTLREPTEQLATI
jgi:two-component system cell cycle response regulator CtrA